MSKDDRSVLSWLGFAAAIAALAVAIFGLRDDGGGGSSSAAGSEGGSSSRPYITITMNDSYRFTPDTIVIPTAGATLHLVNEGGAVHSMEIPELGLTSENLPGGTMYDWELSNLKEGTYTFI
ncbi:MAG: cupredoxin domain-containing protein, partial [Ilumatobacter sp.]|nr:cupredoxin domain-containing protein [Ilumatobacter sp.]